MHPYNAPKTLRKKDREVEGKLRGVTVKYGLNLCSRLRKPPRFQDSSQGRKWGSKTSLRQRHFLGLEPLDLKKIKP